MRHALSSLILASLIACRTPEGATPSVVRTKTLEEAAALYRARRALDTLEDVVAVLEPGTPRAEIERLLGEADGWDDPTIFYRSDRANLAEERLGLTLDFYLWYTDGRETRPSDRVERWILGSGNRFEAADARIPKRVDPPPDPRRAGLETAGAHYRQHHDYDSLRRLVCLLRLGTPRPDVASILGRPDHCSIGGMPCYYATERRNAAGLPLGVMIDYRVHNVGGTETVNTDRVEAVGFGPVPKD